MKTYSYTPYLSFFKVCPVNIIKARLHYEGEEKALYLMKNRDGDWGDSIEFYDSKEEKWPLPNRLELRYVTPYDGNCYAIDAPLDTEKAESFWDKQAADYPRFPFLYVAVGVAPYGNVAVWLSSPEKAVLLHMLKAEKSQLTGEEIYRLGNMSDTGLMKLVLPQEKLNGYLHQYPYLYEVLEEYWNGQDWQQYEDQDPYYDELDLISIEDRRADGTFDFLGEKDFASIRSTGTPTRITLRWKEGRNEFFAHFWLDLFTIQLYFERFFKVYPEGPAVFTLRLDTQTNTYELGLKAERPGAHLLRIPAYTYQFIIFCNDVEHFISENYDKEDGDWNWD